MHPPPHSVARVVRLGGVEPSLVYDDIQLILGTRLREYANPGGHDDFPKDWPGLYDVDSLCHEARGNFVCVSKFVEYLESQVRS